MKKSNILFVSTTYPADEKDWRGRFTANLLEALSHHREFQFDVWAPPGKIPNNVNDDGPGGHQHQDIGPESVQPHSPEHDAAHHVKAVIHRDKV